MIIPKPLVQIVDSKYVDETGKL